MNGNENSQFTDQEQMRDLLYSEKYLTSTYNTVVTECATPEVLSCMTNLLDETHKMQQQVFREMNSRGWYPVAPAEQKKITETKQKFASSVEA